MDTTQVKAKNFASSLEHIQMGVNDLHHSDESEERSDDIETAYKAIQEAISTLNELS